MQAKAHARMDVFRFENNWLVYFRPILDIGTKERDKKSPFSETFFNFKRDSKKQVGMVGTLFSISPLYNSRFSCYMTHLTLSNEMEPAAKIIFNQTLSNCLSRAIFSTNS